MLLTGQTPIGYAAERKGMQIREMIRHPQVQEFADVLGVEPSHAVGLLVGIWDLMEFLGNDEVILEFESGKLCRRLDSAVDPGHLTQALWEAGFLKRYEHDLLYLENWLNDIDITHRRRARSRRRWDRLKAAGGEMSYRDRQAIFERNGFQCVECHVERDLTIDHIIPISKGGTNHPANLQTLCRSCNSRKGDTVPFHATETR